MRQLDPLSVFDGQARLCGQPPIDGQNWIVPGYAPLMCGRIVVRGLVQKFGRFAEHDKTVCKSWRDPQLMMIVRTEFSSHPLTEGG